jgi:hypothetical protein
VVTRYVWANLDVDVIDIGESYFKDFKPVAPYILRLRSEREIGSSYKGEYFDREEIEQLRDFVNLKEIYVVCAEGLYSWMDVFYDHAGCWVCGVENVYFIDPEDGERIFRGPEGLDELFELQKREMEERDMIEQET